mmetsp:Transcript_19419/g.56411  ORF Transcript_19419/g.56411 Transcript_19419/m.56411 type:complete len:237 (+) Transcript_19419:31-741(+)
MAAVKIPLGNVSCGGHVAASCAECPQGNGGLWCHGACVWLMTPTGGACLPAGFVKGVPSVSGDAGTDFVWWATIFTVSGFLMLLFAFAYEKQVVNRMGTIPWKLDPQASRRGLFSCCTSGHTCLYSCFCLPVVLGKNYQAAELMGFWKGCVTSFVLLYSPLYCVGVGVRTILAMEVSDAIGGHQELCSTLCKSMFCMPCDVGRESMQVDEELSATITCCCNLKSTRKTALTQMLSG